MVGYPCGSLWPPVSKDESDEHGKQQTPKGRQSLKAHDDRLQTRNELAYETVGSNAKRMSDPSIASHLSCHSHLGRKVLLLTLDVEASIRTALKV
jgi:hypothetical protein